MLWKWETGTIEDAPPNVMTKTWFPQQDLLAHPKLRFFLSHGGQSSFQESLCHQMPLLVVPVAGDQLGNGKEAERLGVGLSIKFHEATEESLEQAISRLLEEVGFAENARQVGELLLDQETKPIDR